MELHMSTLQVTPFSRFNKIMIWIWRYNPSRNIAMRIAFAIRNGVKSWCNSRLVETHVIVIMALCQFLLRKCVRTGGNVAVFENEFIHFKPTIYTYNLYLVYAFIAMQSMQKVKYIVFYFGKERWFQENWYSCWVGLEV